MRAIVQGDCGRVFIAVALELGAELRERTLERALRVLAALVLQLGALRLSRGSRVRARGQGQRRGEVDLGRGRGAAARELEAELTRGRAEIVVWHERGVLAWLLDRET